MSAVLNIFKLIPKTGIHHLAPPSSLCLFLSVLAWYLSYFLQVIVTHLVAAWQHPQPQTEDTLFSNQEGTVTITGLECVLIWSH